MRNLAKSQHLPSLQKEIEKNLGLEATRTRPNSHLVCACTNKQVLKKEPGKQTKITLNNQTLPMPAPSRQRGRKGCEQKRV